MTSFCSRTPSRMTLDLNMGTAHLMDIIEGPAGFGCDSILIRYQASSSVEDLQEVANSRVIAADDSTTKSSSSTASSNANMPPSRRTRRRNRQRERLDDQIWFVMASIEKYATRFKHLSLRFVGCSFPADALAWLVERVQHIETLHLRVDFHGNLRLLGKAVKRHSNLMQVWIDHCRPVLDDSMLRKRCRNYADKSIETATRADEKVVASLEPLLDGLSKSKTLRCLTLSHSIIAVSTPARTDDAEGQEDSPLLATDVAPSKPGWNAGASLVKFAKMTSLRKLSLERMMEIRDCDLATLADALQSYHSVTTLSVRQCAIGPLAGSAFGRMLSHNRGLQTLDCNIHWWDGMTCEETNIGEYVAKCWEADVISIIHGLQHNTTLKCLGLYCDDFACSHSAAVVSVLGANVEAKSRELCVTVLKEIPKIMQAEESPNCVLEDLIVGHRSFGLTPDIDYFLRWNRAGRRFFCQYENASRFDWMDALLSNRDDLSVLYALVSMNPTMFSG